MRRAVCVGVFALAARLLHAQAPAGLVPCRGQRIDSIAITTEAPTVTGLRRVPVVGDVVREAHVVTRPDVVRRFLLLRVGDRCRELRRAESERILRAQTFIADASIDVYTNRRGGVDLDVHTIDESSIILSGAISGSAPIVQGVRVGSANLAGMGVATSVAWHREPYFDDRLELRVTDYQFAGKPYVLNAMSLRDPLGRDDRAEVTLPFRSDVQHLAWRALIGENRSHAGFTVRDSGQLALGVGRDFLEVGGIGRLGPPGKLSLFGLSFSNERAWPDSVPVIITDVGFRDDTAAGFAGRFMETRASRVNALVGVRGIRFMRARGFDALRAVQDVPLGLQLGTVVGRGVRALHANSNDVFIATDLYLAFGTPRLTYRLQMQGEGRRPMGSKQWDGLIGSGRIARYSRPSDAHTRILSMEWSGTSRVLTPHSLSLGVADGGIRGLRNADAVGGRRLVGRWDEQFYLGSPFSFGDLGVAAFVDGGQLWAGDLPYGETTPVSGGGGVSLLLAAPMRSSRMWRLDLAAPFSPVRGAGSWEVRLSHTDRTSFFWREPRDIDLARARVVPASVYNWP
ncbi:MAG TPA: hypothetical protein VJ867_17600 [Gemmatimonadaceae bacterium]|nr:hypothetical protein [Gemmatimonadaceae bacterium]